MTEIEVLPPRRPAQSEALGQLMAHAEAMSAAKQLADALSQTDMVPKDYKGKPGNAAAAILYGAELGLNPIQSLQQIFIVHGSPAIYARTAVALVKQHGVLVETVESANDAVTVRATDARTGQVEQATWDMARAKLAGYTSNAKYNTNPQEMLYAKAAMEVCRKIAPDVLLGVPYAREELDLETEPRRVRSERVGRGVDGLRAALGASEEAPKVDNQQVNVEPPNPVTTAQNRKMHALFRDAELSDRDARLAVTSAIVGYTIDTSSYLTSTEASKIIDTLERWQAVGVLADQVREIINAATIAAENTKEEIAQ